MSSAALMLVSASVDSAVREAVAERSRPRPEYLLLEQEHCVELLDWSRLPPSRRRRTALGVAYQATAGLRALPGHEVVFSDSEHVGIPLALAMRTLGVSARHLVIGHRLTTPSKARVMRRLNAHQGMSRILVHSPYQADAATRDLGIPTGKLVCIPYYADTEFWAPRIVDEERLVVAAGREHRDYATLADACGPLDVSVFIAAGSVHSPAATTREPLSWPDNFTRSFADYRALRDLYARSSVVVVPLLETDFQAGVTTVLEAMSMAKPVVVTKTRGRCPVVIDGVTGLSVPPGDASQLADAVRFLLDNPRERHRIGAAARDAVVGNFSVERYVERLAGHLNDLARGRAAA